MPQTTWFSTNYSISLPPALTSFLLIITAEIGDKSQLGDSFSG